MLLGLHLGPIYGPTGDSGRACYGTGKCSLQHHAETMTGFLTTLGTSLAAKGHGAGAGDYADAKARIRELQWTGGKYNAVCAISEEQLAEGTHYEGCLAADSQ